MLIRMAVLTVAIAASAAAAPAPAKATFTPMTFEAQDGQKVAAEKGEFTVPENRNKPGSRNIAIRFVRFKSTAANPGPSHRLSGRRTGRFRDRRRDVDALSALHVIPRARRRDRLRPARDQRVGRRGFAVLRGVRDCTESTAGSGAKAARPWPRHAQMRRAADRGGSGPRRLQHARERRRSRGSPQSPRRGEARALGHQLRDAPGRGRCCAITRDPSSA